MKRINILLLGMLFLAIPIFISNAQNLEAEKTYELSKDAKKGYLGSFNYSETAKEYTLVFVREKNKKTIYVTYKFDYDFNQISEVEEELTDVEASKKFDFVGVETGDTWNNPAVVRVDGDSWNMNQVVLRRGYMKRTWVRPTTTYSGDYIMYTPGYYKYDFVEEEKVKPKIPVDLDLDPRTPKMVVNMAMKAAEKIKLVTYQTDEPEVEVQTGAAHFHPKAGTYYLKRKRNYAEASGDVMMLGYQMWYIQKDAFIRYVALLYDAKDLSLKEQTIIEFDYLYSVVAHKFLPDQSLAIVFAPQGLLKNPGPNPNTREYYYMRISKDAKVMEKFKFESPSSKWNINDFVMTPSGDVYLYGEAFMAKNDKHFDKVGNVSKFDNFQLMKVTDGKLAYITSTPIDEFKAKLQFPPNMKKADPYIGKKFEVGPLTVTKNGDVFVSGQNLEGGKYGDITLFQFDSNGKLKAQYAYRLQETNPTAIGQTTTHVEFENPDDKTFTWIIYEIRGREDNKLLLYPRVATIDLESAKVSDFGTYGFSKKEKYYCDNNRPIILIENDEKAVFFGTDLKDKVLWFCRVKLGQ